MDTNRGDWKKFFNVHREALESDKYKSIFTVRFKIILISYLLQIPEYFGIPSWSPFLNLNVVAKILSLPDSERANRLWQKKYFSNSMDINNIRLRYSTSNTLDFDIAQKHDFSSIIHSPFTGIIKEKRIEYINNTLRKTGWVNNSINSMLTTRYLRGVLRRVGLKNRYLIALKEYFVIKAIEKSL